jgi:L-histidine N-alpha-methyltransferase
MTPSSPSPRQRFTLIAMDTGKRLAAFARDVSAGLTHQPKTLPCCYFYDREGSLLFEEICELPEYYLPRAESVILRAYAGDIVAAFPQPVTLVELGSGNAAKTRILIAQLLHQQQTLCYVPVDICRTVLEESSRELLKEFAGLEIVAVAGEYQEGLRHLNTPRGSPKLILWLGSNVGNFERAEAAKFLRRVGETMTAEDRLLVGIDLHKERRVLEQAYDDTQGITAQFNRNLLARINRELGGHFDLDTFRHRATYNEDLGRIEMYLVSTRSQQVRIDQLNLEVRFEASEAIHTENSYKYTQEQIDALAADAGLGLQRQWLDEQRRFSVNLLALPHDKV